MGYVVFVRMEQAVYDLGRFHAGNAVFRTEIVIVGHHDILAVQHLNGRQLSRRYVAFIGVCFHFTVGACQAAVLQIPIQDAGKFFPRHFFIRLERAVFIARQNALGRYGRHGVGSPSRLDVLKLRIR